MRNFAHVLGIVLSKRIRQIDLRIFKWKAQRHIHALSTKEIH